MKKLVEGATVPAELLDAVLCESWARVFEYDPVSEEFGDFHAELARK